MGAAALALTAAGQDFTWAPCFAVPIPQAGPASHPPAPSPTPQPQPTPSSNPRQEEHDAYKKRCQEPEPPGLDACASRRWNLQRKRDCRDMMQGWDDKWQPGRHAPDIQNLDRGIQNDENWIQKNCP